MAKLFNEPYKISGGGSYAAHLGDGSPERRRLAGVDLIINSDKDTYGKPVFARFGGLKQDLIGSYGEKYVTITHGDTTRYYVHLKEFAGVNGKWINEGDLIGYAGNTGWVEPKPTASKPWLGSHLHYMKFVNGVNVDPTNEIEFFNSYNIDMNDFEVIISKKNGDLGDSLRRAGIDNPGDASQKQNVANLNLKWIGKGATIKSHNGSYQDMERQLQIGDIVRVRGNPSDIQVLDSEIEVIRKENGALKKKVNDLNQINTNMETKIGIMQGWLDDKDKAFGEQIESLELQISALKSEIAELKKPKQEGFNLIKYIFNLLQRKK